MLKRRVFMDFQEFLHKSKTNGYAGSAKPKILADGGFQIEIQEGRFVYRDTWETFARNREVAGREEASSSGREWEMGYVGRLYSEFKPTRNMRIIDVYNFLREALRHAPKNAPFRGPKKFSKGRLSYECVWTGNLEHFRGVEYLLLDGEKIHRLSFEGGFKDRTVKDYLPA